MRDSLNFINTSKLHFGNSQELTVYHDGFNGNSYIEESHSSGNLYIRSTDMYFENTGGNKKYAVLVDLLKLLIVSFILLIQDFSWYGLNSLHSSLFFIYIISSTLISFYLCNQFDKLNNIKV